MGDKANEVQSFYDRETVRYLDERYTAETCESYAYNSRKGIVLDFLNGIRGSIIDVGCGPAIYTRELLDRGFTVTAVDISPEMLKKAQELTGERAGRVTWGQCDIEHICFPDETFDTVMAIGVIAYAKDTLTALRELHRVLKPGGTLVLQCTNAISPAKNIYNLKDSLTYALGIRKKWYNFTLTSHPFGRLKGLLEQADFRVLEKRSYDFRVPFLDNLSRSGAVSVMKFLHRTFSTSALFGWLGEGYIIKAVKPATGEGRHA